MTSSLPQIKYCELFVYFVEKSQYFLVRTRESGLAEDIFNFMKIPGSWSLVHGPDISSDHSEVSATVVKSLMRCHPVP